MFNFSIPSCKIYENPWNGNGIPRYLALPSGTWTLPVPPPDFSQWFPPSFFVLLLHRPHFQSLSRAPELWRFIETCSHRNRVSIQLRCYAENGWCKNMSRSEPSCFTAERAKCAVSVHQFIHFHCGCCIVLL